MGSKGLGEPESNNPSNRHRLPMQADGTARAEFERAAP
jgi:hypothetical protein